MVWIKTKNVRDDAASRGTAEFNAAVMVADRVDAVARGNKHRDGEADVWMPLAKDQKSVPRLAGATLALLQFRTPTPLRKTAKEKGRLTVKEEFSLNQN